ncbi:MAG TPA: polynucleotide adenylyltransferase PcnB, partial [Candidatus Polarisedimenticolaceae bacterium]|nr:polynucleotide adenylyltransferase PcnB [Candidatus Polarisedimenticolaceae bacterium]
MHRPIPVHDLDADAVKIVQRLTRFDHTAYLVGGCVRDLLLERRPKDFDIGTSATPRQIKRVFRNCRIIGRRFRLAHIYFQNGKIIEVATFRAQDGDDAAPGEDLLIREDNQFGTPEEDALRRDFTINALFYDVNGETVLDHADGLSDLRRGLVRTIGDPEVRFRQDPIRILRAIKFAARLDFAIEPATLEALRRTRQEIPRAAPPRILEEFNRFCRGGAARRSFELMRETGVFDVVLPELDYGDDPARAALLFDALQAMDRRCGNGTAPATGEIFAALLLPLLAERLGWRRNGDVTGAPGLNVIGLVDELLRPIALRLRMSRRDQEHCRLILATVARLAAA